ncbi:MAG: hypothetical protein ACTHMY_29260 [Solirubrobacteraceae bacterium]
MARLPLERLPLARLVLERELVERDLVERVPLEREADERVPDAREDAAEREPLARDVVERLAVFAPVRAVPEAERVVLRAEREADAPAELNALRSLSNSLRACLLVLVASRRSVRSAAVTSL